jgi:Alternate to MurJ
VTDLWTPNLLIAVCLTVVTQAIQIGAYAARYAGVVTGRIATAISLFSLLVTASRLASLFMTPALGALADGPANYATDAHLKAVPPELLAHFDLQIRLIIAAGSVGILIGGLLLPMFLTMFVRGIGAFERFGSIPRALMRLFDPLVMRDLGLAVLRPPQFRLANFPISAIPRQLLVANVVLFAFYSVGVVAAYYASVLDLHARLTAGGLSGLVNGIGTIAFALFIDPNTAFIVDQTVRNERPRRDVSAMIFWLIVTAFIGTILAQLILDPAAHYIAAVANFWITFSRR